MKRWLLTSVAAAALAAPAGAAAPAAVALSSLASRPLPVVALPATPALSLGAPLLVSGSLLPAQPLATAIPGVPSLPGAAAAVAPRVPGTAIVPGLPGSQQVPEPVEDAGGATALSRLQLSALDGADAVKPEASAAGAKSLAARSFDGAAARAAGEDAAVPAGDGDAAAPALPSYLDVPEPEHAAWIASVVAQLQGSRAGRVILSRLEQLAKKRGRPVIVVVAPIANAGEYAFDHEIVTMDAKFMAGPPLEAAPVFAHELAHVLQLAQGLPADAFEMELEAYLVQFQVSEDLGFKPKRGTFHWSAFRRFKNDVDRFIAWLLKEYDGNIAIVGKGGLDDYAAELDVRHADSEARIARLEKRAASKRRVLERMAATGQPAALIEQYRLDELAPLEEKLRVERRTLGWLERDLLLLRTPESRERYRRYAERVLKKARLYHARLNAAA